MNTNYNMKQNQKLQGAPLAVSTRRKRRQRRLRNATPIASIYNSPSMYTGSGPINPGRAHLRSVIEVKNGSAINFMSYQSFNLWWGQARQVLGPYSYFRIVDFSAEAMVDGGAASPYSIAFNVSNNPFGDNNFGGVMNDDYSGLCTALSRPVVHPPRSYWRDLSQNWRLAIDPISTNNPTDVERINGSSSVWGSGGEADETIIGWLVYTMEIEYHTLL